MVGRVGIAAIVASIAFVGMEIRQSAAATRGATQQALADASREASGGLVADEAVAELTMRFLNATDWSSFSETGRFRVVLLFSNERFRSYYEEQMKTSDPNPSLEN